MHILSKSTYIKGEQCEKALYLFKNRPFLRDKLSMEQRAKFKRGTDVGILAQQLFPGGINMTPSSPSQFGKKVTETMQNLSNPAVNVMYEAVFQYDDTLIMLDIIVRDGDKWRAIEVKSSLSISPTYMKDAALQYYVLKGCNVPLSDIQLMYINADYVRNGDLNLSQLFVFQSVKDYAEQYQDVIAKNIAHFKDIIKQPHSPKIPIGNQCDAPYRCEFHGHCWKDVPNELDKPYTIDYKLLYELLGDRNKSTAFLNLLFYRPAVPLFDGDKPYTEFIIGFSILSNNGQFDKIYNWNCLDDLSRWKDSLELLATQLAGFERVICFASQNIQASLQKYNVLESKVLNYKILNFREVLQQSGFEHEKVKNDFSLKNVYETVFPDKTLFEHSRIILNALSENVLERNLITSDLEMENKALREIYKKVINIL
ncbi:MAG: hypothetical protein J6W12_02625 [Bacteroidales bacterium]|nr:hypothetical protein [Bacteroidales bacterium]